MESDHKPLEAVFKKHLSSAPPRLERMLLRIQKYDVQIKHPPGKDIPVADALSRISSCPGKAVQGLDISVHEVHPHLNASPTRVCQIQEETAKDSTLSSCFSGTNQKPELRRPFGTGLVRHCPQGPFSPFFTFLRVIYFPARLDFSSSPLSAPGSPRMKQPMQFRQARGATQEKTVSTNLYFTGC